MPQTTKKKKSSRPRISHISPADKELERQPGPIDYIGTGDLLDPKTEDSGHSTPDRIHSLGNADKDPNREPMGGGSDGQEEEWGDEPFDEYKGPADLMGKPRAKRLRHDDSPEAKLKRSREI